MDIPSRTRHAMRGVSGVIMTVEGPKSMYIFLFVRNKTDHLNPFKGFLN